MSRSSCSETAYSEAKKRELYAWDAVEDDVLTVSSECSAPVTFAYNMLIRGAWSAAPLQSFLRLA